jgi:hypothetical protein
MDPRERRRAEARLESLRRDLGSFRASMYLAIGRGDPAWVKRCHKAVREQEEKIRLLREVHGLEQPG